MAVDVLRSALAAPVEVKFPSLAVSGARVPLLVDALAVSKCYAVAGYDMEMWWSLLGGCLDGDGLDGCANVL